MKNQCKQLLATLATTGILGVIALYLYTRPALQRLPKTQQQSLHGITTIDDAVHYLQSTRKTSWALVAAAQKLVNAKMAYSRRNGWDTPAHAFQRGMGYCQQQGMALLLILRKLGFAVRPVHAFRCQFPPHRIHEYMDPGGISGHMWVVVTIDGVEKDVCPGHPDNEPGIVHFERLSPRREYGPAMRVLGHVGSLILNVQRDNAAVKREALAV